MATIVNSPTFLPTQISGLALWFDAADRSTISTTISTTGTVVVQWNDKSGRGFTATESGSPYINPIYASTLWNGQPVLSFNNSNSEMQINNLQFSNQGRSIFTVYQVPNYPSLRGIALLTRLQPTFQQFAIGAVNIISLGANGITSAVMATSNGWNNSNINIISAVQSANSANNTINVNGIPQTLYLNCNAGSYATTAFTAQLGIGVSRNGNYGVPFNLGEVIQYSNDLTLSQTQQVEAYLAWKWGLQSSLPTTHPYYYNQSISNLILNTQLSGSYSQTNVSLFLPTQISGCSLWLDAADQSSVIRTGSNVSAWNDKSGNGNNATQITGANQPVFSNNSIVFSGSKNLDFTNPNALCSNTTFSIFFVEQRATSSNTNYILAGSVNGTNQNLHVGYNTVTVFRFSFYANDLNYSVPTFSAGNEPFRIWAVGQSNTGRTVHLNGTLGSSDSYTTLLTSWNGGNIGKNPFGVGTAYYQGTINEVIFFKPALTTTAQRQQVEGYLAWKWGLQANLPTTHPFYFNQAIANLRLPTQVITPFSIRNNSGFLPSQITGLGLWLDAADTKTITLNSNNITQWNDKSGSNNNSVSVFGTTTYNNNLIRFEGDYYGSYIVLPSINISTSNMTVFAFLRFTSSYTYPTDANYYYVDFLSGQTSPPLNLGLVRFNSAPYFWILNYYTAGGATNGQGALTSGAGGPSGTRYLFSIVNTQNIYTQFSSGTNINTTNTPGFTPNTSQTFYIGTGANGIEIGEIIMYPTTALTIRQRQQIEGYLAWKWGLQANLPTSHPFFLFPPG